MGDRTIGFIGGGRVTRIILGGWSNGKRLASAIVVSDTDAAILAKLQARHRTIATAVNDNARAAAQDIVFLAVHPPAIADALRGVAEALGPGAIFVSLAPKLSCAKLGELLNGFDRLARMIPNAGSIVGAGYNPISFSDGLPAAGRDALTELLGPLGPCPQVTESKLEAYALITAMGPTYFWPQFYELLGLAGSFGLSDGEAREGLHEMVVGALRTMNSPVLSAEEVQDLIPVKPLADLQPGLLNGYRTKLSALWEKIRP